MMYAMAAAGSDEDEGEDVADDVDAASSASGTTSPFGHLETVIPLP